MTKMTKANGLALACIFLAWMVGAPLAWGQGKTTVQLDSIGDPELRGAAEKNASAVITEFNRAEAFGERPDLSEAPVTDRGREALLSRWEEASFFCNQTQLNRSLVQREGETYEIQDIPLIVEGEEPRSGVLLLNGEGTVIGFRYSTEPATGTITIASEPSGARVVGTFGDTTATRAAPARFAGVPAGRHRFTIRKEAHEAVDTTLAVVAGQARRVTISLEPERAPLRVRPASRQDEAVSGIRIERDEDQIVVTYDLVGQEDEYEVALLLSTDGGATFQELRGTVEGAVGEDIAPGSGRQITWAALTDYPEGLAGDQYRLRVGAEAVDGGNTLLWVLGSALVAGAGGTVALLLGGGGDGGGDGGSGGEKYPTPPTPPGN